ncbi:MAG: acyl--CoA ligase [Verrucomicrobia bacterium]|nr:acyl--CoA ligase [Verrucomicrobiota bacterium]MDA1087331.1 acyl--CoA ligase [Verrucomicrobiota bacterium]
MTSAHDVIARRVSPGSNPPGSSNAPSIRGLIQQHAVTLGDSASLLAPCRQALTYRELLETVDRAGAALRSIGISRSDRVAVVLPNGPEMAATFVAVASCAACAPLNPRFGADEFEFYLADLQAAALLVEQGDDGPARKVAQDRGIPVLELVVDRARAAGSFSFRVDPADQASEIGSTIEGGGAGDDVALILHTSGTTSRPKMVPLTHANVCASAGNVARTLQLSDEDRCLNLMPLFHIHGLVGVLLSSLVAGASVVCAPGFREDQIAGWMREFKPSWYSAVPTIHQAMLEVARSSTDVWFDSLRLIRSSSSALPPQVMSDLERTFGVPVIESYGMTEAAHQMTSNPLPPAVRKPGSVGLPAGPEIGIMDEHGNSLAPGGAGEIVIRGPGVTTGYIGNPEANATAFTAGWFRTGDLGHVDEDGYLFISGRKKEMINRGGEKVSPREIDEALLEHELVAQAVAFAVPHATLGEDIAAAVVLRNASDVDENALRRFAFGRLAPFKVPSRIIFIESIPKGPTGKLQRIGLHRQLEKQLRSEYVEPRTDLERFVVVAIEEILDVSGVGANHNFFALGGDSLKGAPAFWLG